jgi:hypothetical protein
MFNDRYEFGDVGSTLSQGKKKIKTTRCFKTMKFPAQVGNPFFKMPSKQQSKKMFSVGCPRIRLK